jgi:uncharacterized protein YuzE
MAIYVSSDTDNDLHVLHLSDEPVARTVERGDGCLIDVDARGDAVAIEILDRQACDLRSLADEFGFASCLDEAVAVLAEAGVELGVVVAPSAVVATGGTTTWAQTDTVIATAQIPAQNIDLIPA